MRALFLAAMAASSLVIGPVSAPADATSDPSVAQIEAKLAQSRQRLTALYDQAALTGQRYTGALAGVDRARKAVERERRAARQTRAQLADQSAAVADLTVQQLQNQSGLTPYLSMLHSSGPQELLARASAYDSAADAMTAKVDELSARTTVHEAAERRLEAAQARQEHAALQADQARTAINEALRRSQQSTLAAEAERGRLLRQLAARENKPIETVTEEHSAPAPSATPTPAAGTTVPTPSVSAFVPSPTPTPTVAPTVQPAPPVQPVPPAEPADPGGEWAPPEPYGVWDKIAKCESGGNWHINTGNGYYGGLQFSARTWHSVGGPGLPHQYSREVQIKYAKILQKRSGWGQWSCAGARFD